MMRLVVVGDSLLDRDLVGSVDRLCPDAPVPVVDEPVAVTRPGGAGLAALLAAQDGRDVVLVTALCDDEDGRRLRSLLFDAGVELVDLGAVGSTVTKTRIRSEGRTLLRIDAGSSAVAGDLVGDLSDGTVLVADYGRGLAGRPRLRRALEGRQVVWDPHPRGPAPVQDCALVTPNAAEAAAFTGLPGTSLRAAGDQAQLLRERWSCRATCITLGGAGALLMQGGSTPSVYPAPVVACADPCGAGDRFASAAAGLLADGALVSEAVGGAVASAAAFVASGGAAAVPSPPSPGVADDDVAARTRAAGGTVVATGGCFDLLHAGHVAVLQQARRLGDCLVVLLNSDASVRRLKGPGRPLQRQADRAHLLQALACVDAVVVFDEDTPVRALEQVRPDVWAKGGDYAGLELPEARLLDSWGGAVVALPYLEGRSTTTLIRRALRHA